jgi:hypothetical protein
MQLLTMLHTALYSLSNVIRMCRIQPSEGRMKHLERLAVALLMFYMLGCTNTRDPRTMLRNELAATLSVEDSLYFRETYGMEDFDNMSDGALSIQYASVLQDGYDAAIETWSAPIADEGLIIALQGTEHLYATHLGGISRMWQNALERGAGAFQRSFEILTRELQRKDVPAKVDELQRLVAARISQLPRSEYSSTYELLDVLGEMSAQVKSPSGSLPTFNQSVSNARNRFNRELAVTRTELQ